MRNNVKLWHYGDGITVHYGDSLLNPQVPDLGPEWGVKGGKIVAEGTPEDVVKVAASYTGHHLKALLERAS
jgi:hypothetical protein